MDLPTGRVTWGRATLFLAPLITWAIDVSSLRSRQPDANAAAMQAVATITVATNYLCEVG